MIRLLKSELYKLIREKTLLICVLIIAGFALLSIVTSAIAMNVLVGDDFQELASLFNGRGAIYGAMSLTNNGGFVILIAAAIILCKDFNYGTIRNVITSGHSRLSIFTSKFIVGIIIFLALGLVNLLWTTALSAVLLDYGNEITTTVVLNLIRDFALCLLIYIWAQSLVVLFAFIFKKSVFVILLTIGSLFVLLLLTSLFGNGQFDEAITYICSLVPVYQLGNLIAPQTNEMITKIIISNIILIGLNFGLGALAFYKSDLK